MQSKLTTSGATNSGVPKRTCRNGIRYKTRNHIIYNILNGPATHSQTLVGIKFACQAKVNDLDAIALLCEHQNVLRLQIQMDNAVTVYKGHGLAYLTYKDTTHALREHEFIVHHTIEQFAALDAWKEHRLKTINMNYKIKFIEI